MMNPERKSERKSTVPLFSPEAKTYSDNFLTRWPTEPDWFFDLLLEGNQYQNAIPIPTSNNQQQILNTKAFLKERREVARSFLNSLLEIPPEQTQSLRPEEVLAPQVFSSILIDQEDILKHQAIITISYVIVRILETEDPGTLVADPQIPLNEYTEMRESFKNKIQENMPLYLRLRENAAPLLRRYETIDESSQ
jgi:hypothetical protein